MNTCHITLYHFGDNTDETFFASNIFYNGWTSDTNSLSILTAIFQVNLG